MREVWREVWVARFDPGEQIVGVYGSRESAEVDIPKRCAFVRLSQRRGGEDWFSFVGHREVGTPKDKVYVETERFVP